MDDSALARIIDEDSTAYFRRGIVIIGNYVALFTYTNHDSPTSRFHDFTNPY